MAPKVAADAKAKAKAKPKADKKEEDTTAHMERPDRAGLDAAVQKIQEDIDALKAKQQKLSEKIGERRGGSEVFNAKRQELMAQRNEFTEKIDVLVKQKEGINGQIGEKRAEGQALKGDLAKMKKSIGFTSEADIDQKIKEIEFKMHHDSISLKDEKKYLQEIQELKRNRPKVAQVNKKEEELKGVDYGSSMKGNIQGINAEINALRDGRKKIQEALTELIEGRKSEMGDMGPIIAEKEEISKRIPETMPERNTLRDEFRAKEQEYRKYMDEVRAERQKKSMEEREARNKEYDLVRRQRAADKLDEQPHVAEMTLIEQTMAFCKSLTASKGPVVAEEKKETSYDLPDGAEVMLKKEDREEFYYAPTAAKKKGKKKGGAKEGGSSKPIKHNAVTFGLFDTLKLDAPITTDEIPALLEKLEAQLEEYKEKVKVWEEKREELKKKILEDGFDPASEEKKEEEAEEKAAEKAED
uniref:Nuclear segregation protein n=1 Tax=Strombidinopsis acuminata TaxID=141414 RepID=A0A7S3WR56_9SPIT|mmetsp:Transcript_50427/g.69015  ORF Transcript_50427/g.69015 Transcript_50427/m.69015 type:complete len:470 (+) Transcript_50427:80-1489(+)